MKPGDFMLMAVALGLAACQPGKGNAVEETIDWKSLEFTCIKEKIPPVDKEAAHWFKSARAIQKGERSGTDAQMIELYEMAAAKNHFKAIINLASIYAHGDGVEPDESRAVELLERAMRMDAPLAYYNMGAFLSQGIGVKKDQVAALAYFRKAADLGIDLNRRKPTGIKAAIIREKGVNGDREMAYAMYLAGMDVKDVHMTDLIAGRETLEDLNMIVFVGGFSNSDVLGSAKGWAGAFKYNEKARIALGKFYRRDDTLSLGVCNGCQVMVELGLVYPEHSIQPKMLHNESGKFESTFINVDILENNSVMLKNMAGMKLGIWVAHGEGKFYLPFNEQQYIIPMKFSHDEYPANPNGSHYAAASLSSEDGRHLVMMPHLERAFKPWQWPYYPAERKMDEVAPWIQAFVNARNWIAEKAK